jgi:nitroreductase
MNFEEAVKKRASIRKFSSRKPNVELIIKAIEIANLAPSPGNIPILKYIIVEDENSIERIADACQQEFIKQSKILLVICSEEKRTELAYEKRARKYIKQHAGAAIENLLLYLTNIGLVTCWVGAFSDIMLKDVLKISDEVDIEAILPIGYRFSHDKTTQRKKSLLENRVFFEVWKNKFRKPFKSALD